MENDSVWPAVRAVYTSKTLRRLLLAGATAFGGWVGSWAWERASHNDVAAAEQRLNKRIAQLAANVDPAKVDARVKRTEAQAAAAVRIAETSAAKVADSEKARREVETNLYLRLVSLQTADAESNRALKARAASDARREFLMLVNSGTTPQRAAEIVLESPMPGDYENRRRTR